MPKFSLVATVAVLLAAFGATPNVPAVGPLASSPSRAPIPVCGVTGAVPIRAADDAQKLVDSHPSGTTYLVATGTHWKNFDVTPKDGDRFCGEGGTVLDGGRTLARAFGGAARNVTLDSITIQNYESGIQGAAIKPDLVGAGWVLRNMTVRRNAYFGVSVANEMKILGGHYVLNQQAGIGGNQQGRALEVTLDGLDKDPGTFDGPEVAWNRANRTECGNEGGGIKLDADKVVIRNVWIHDNDCLGLWFDINSKQNLIEHNKIEDNAREGIFYEISQDACVRNNVIRNNGGRVSKGWYWAGGVTLAESFNIEIYGNTLMNNHNGITGIQQTRTDWTPPVHLLDHVYVHDNVVSGGGISNVVADNGDNLSSRDIVYRSNSYGHGHDGRNDSKGPGYRACAILGFGAG